MTTSSSTDFIVVVILLCAGIEMLREIQDFIASLDGEKYDHMTEDQKRYRLLDQWSHNLHLVKKENEEFYKWPKGIEEKIGRKARVIDRIAEHLKIRDKL